MSEKPQLTPPGAGIDPTRPESKLSPTQQEQVHSPEFIEWFGDWQNDPNGAQTSKMVDPVTGEPQVFYHGTNRQFDISAPRMADKAVQLSNHGLSHDYAGIYLSESEAFTRQYADPLGASFRQTMSFLARQFDVADKPQPVFEKWNELLRSCQESDGRTTITEGSSNINPEQFAEALADGRINFSSFLKFDGRTVGLVGEQLQHMGGSFPTAQDELVPYTSLYELVQQDLDRLTAAGIPPLLIPRRAEARIIPVFVRATSPAEFTQNGNDIKAMDNAFWTGIHDLETHPENGHDAVIAHTPDLPIGVNLLVLDPAQLREAAP